ncbi:MAG: sulfatase-like hydrolase/transferase [Isosphaeraceae bacterium]
MSRGLRREVALGPTRPSPDAARVRRVLRFLGGAHTYFVETSRDLYRGEEVVKESAYLTDALGAEAVAFVGRHKDHPFFLELAFNAVHTPMNATPDRLDDSARSRTAAAAPTRRCSWPSTRRLARGRGAPRRRPGAEHADRLHQRQRRSDDGRHLGQRFAEHRSARLERIDAEGGIAPVPASWSSPSEGKTYDAPR